MTARSVRAQRACAIRPQGDARCFDICALHNMFLFNCFWLFPAPEGMRVSRKTSAEKFVKDKKHLHLVFFSLSHARTECAMSTACCNHHKLLAAFLKSTALIKIRSRGRGSAGTPRWHHGVSRAEKQFGADPGVWALPLTSLSYPSWWGAFFLVDCFEAGVAAWSRSDPHSEL